MSIYVHLCDEKYKKIIQSNGIKTSKIHYEKINKGVFCMPVTNDFYLSHQWLREIKQQHASNNIIAIYFKIPDDELVFCGKYNEEGKYKASSDAFNTFVGLKDKLGFQVIIPRKILKAEIQKIKNLPQIIGWRYYPKSHGKKICLCPACLGKGTYNSKNIKLNRREELIKQLIQIDEDEQIIGLLYEIGDINTSRKLNKKEESIISKYLTSDNNMLVVAAINILSKTRQSLFTDYLKNTFIMSADKEIKEACLEGLIRILNTNVITTLDSDNLDLETKEILNKYKFLYEL